MSQTRPDLHTVLPRLREIDRHGNELILCRKQKSYVLIITNPHVLNVPMPFIVVVQYLELVNSWNHIETLIYLQLFIAFWL